MSDSGQSDVASSFIERVVGKGDVESVGGFFRNQSDPLISRVQESVRRLHRAVPNVEVSIDRIMALPDEVVVFHTIHAKPTQEDVQGTSDFDIDAVARFELEGTKLAGLSGYLSQAGVQKLSSLTPKEEEDEELWPYGIAPPDQPTLG
jgi:hypothetical protein